MLSSTQRKYLRGQAHNLKPVVMVGQKGFGPQLVSAAESALTTHELIKVKFNEFKEKAQKQTICDALCRATGCELAGILGHTAIFYRAQADPEKRKIKLP
ncbi:MAG: YhbY family RNA-binding protein [Desulfobacterales bacterium]